MTVIKAHFDGNNIVLDEPANLKPNAKVKIIVEEEILEKKPENGEQKDLLSIFGEPVDMGIEDLSVNLDHSLYGTLKRPD